MTERTHLPRCANPMFWVFLPFKMGHFSFLSHFSLFWPDLPCFSFSSHLLLSLRLFPLLTRSPGFPSGPGLTPVPADGQLGATDGQWRCACAPLNNLNSKDLVWAVILSGDGAGAGFLVFTAALVGCLIRLRCPIWWLPLWRDHAFQIQKTTHKPSIRHQKSPFFDPKIFHITSDTHFHRLLLYSPFSFKALNFYLLRYDLI